MNDAALVIAGQLEDAQTPCITCSFQAEDVVVLHMLRQQRPEIAVLFLDTVHDFAHTYAYRDELMRAWNLRLVNLRAAEPAPGLWQTSTGACCAKHKVEPLFSTLDAYDLWFTGLRREQSPSRPRGHGLLPLLFAASGRRPLSPPWSRRRSACARANRTPAAGTRRRARPGR